MSEEARQSSPSPIGRWVETHDDRWSFTLSYVALAVLLSTTISLFWLAMLLATHMALEWWARTRRGDRGRTLLAVVWHVKLDVTLVLFALALGLYFDVLFGLLGLGALARSGTQLTARVVAWQRGLRTILLTADDAAIIAKAATHRRRGDPVPAEPADTDAAGARRAEPWRWSRGDVATVAMACVFALLILAAPVLTEHDVSGVLGVLAAELHPWPR
jgi:hypothetical protein